MPFPKNIVGAGEPDGDEGAETGQGAPAPNPFKKKQMKGYKAGVRKIRNSASSPKGIKKSGAVVKSGSSPKGFFGK